MGSAYDPVPDGGYGWVCLACTTAVQACTFGANAGYGVFLEFYLQNNAFPDATSMDYALIAGLIVFNAQFWSSLSIMVSQILGIKLTMSIACVTHLLGYIFASLSKRIWQLYLSQGVLMGISYSFLFVPAGIVVPQWFSKRRALASGISFSGTGLGGVIYSVSVDAMIQRTGNQIWALRMCGISTFVIIGVSIIFIKERIPIKRVKWTTKNITFMIRTMFKKEVIQQKPLWFITLWFGLSILGYNMILFSYATYCTTVGLSHHQASILTSLMNAAQTIGRPVMGLIADKWVGRVNFAFILDIVIIIIVFAFWINAKTFISLLFCSILLGGTLGVGNVMNPVFIADSFPVEDFASAWSILNMCMGFFSIGVEVIALSLRDNSLPNPFIYTQMTSGLIFVVAALILLLQREWTIRKDLKALSANLELELTQPELNDLHDLMAPSLKNYIKRMCKFRKV